MEKTPKDIVKYQKHYTKERLDRKLVRWSKRAGQKVIYLALLLYYALTDKKTPIGYKAIILGALGYFILPLDMLPDFILGLGFTDDMAALLAAYQAIQASVTPEVEEKAKKRMKEFFHDYDGEDIRLEE